MPTGICGEVPACTVPLLAIAAAAAGTTAADAGDCSLLDKVLQDAAALAAVPYHTRSLLPLPLPLPVLLQLLLLPGLLQLLLLPWQAQWLHAVWAMAAGLCLCCLLKRFGHHGGKARRHCTVGEHEAHQLGLLVPAQAACRHTGDSGSKSAAACLVVHTDKGCTQQGK